MSIQRTQLKEARQTRIATWLASLLLHGIILIVGLKSGLGPGLNAPGQLMEVTLAPGVVEKEIVSRTKAVPRKVPVPQRQRRPVMRVRRQRAVMRVDRAHRVTPFRATRSPVASLPLPPVASAVPDRPAPARNKPLTGQPANEAGGVPTMPGHDDKRWKGKELPVSGDAQPAFKRASTSILLPVSKPENGGREKRRHDDAFAGPASGGDAHRPWSGALRQPARDSQSQFEEPVQPVSKETSGDGDGHRPGPQVGPDAIRDGAAPRDLVAGGNGFGRTPAADKHGKTGDNDGGADGGVTSANGSRSARRDRDSGEQADDGAGEGRYRTVNAVPRRNRARAEDDLFVASDDEKPVEVREVLSRPTPEPQKPQQVRHVVRTKAKFRGSLRTEYPREAERLGLRGSVRLRVTVSIDGQLDVMVTRSSGYEILDQAAVRDIYRKKRDFEPAREDGRLVASQVVVTVRFD